VYTGQVSNNNCPGYSGTCAAEEVKDSGDNDNKNTAQYPGNKGLSDVVVSNRILFRCILSKQV